MLSYLRSVEPSKPAPSLAKILNDSWQKIWIAAGILFVIVIALTLAHQWRMAQRADAAYLAAQLDDIREGCRPLAKQRMKNEILRTGRPLTRGEAAQMIRNIDDCDIIDEQMRVIAS